MVRRLQQQTELGIHRLGFGTAHSEERGVKGCNVALEVVTTASSQLLPPHVSMAKTRQHKRYTNE